MISGSGTETGCGRELLSFRSQRIMEGNILGRDGFSLWEMNDHFFARSVTCVMIHTMLHLASTRLITNGVKALNRKRRWLFYTQ